MVGARGLENNITLHTYRSQGFAHRRDFGKLAHTLFITTGATLKHIPPGRLGGTVGWASDS